MTFLFGTKSVIYYRIIYVVGFFLASFTDTSIIWTFSGITIAFMTIPNLIGIFSLRKEVKSTIADYWKSFSKEHPDVKIPSKLCFELVVPPSIPAFEQLLETGGVDYAFMNPYHQVMVKDTYQPLIRDDQRQLKGVLVIHRKSTVNTLDDLKGQTIAFPAPNAFAASLLIRADLRQRGIPIEADYVTSHSNVYRSVAMKLSSAGGGVNNTLNREEPEIARHLKILHTTRGYAAHPFSALRSLPTAETTALAEAWLALGNQSQQQGNDNQNPHATAPNTILSLCGSNFRSCIQIVIACQHWPPMCYEVLPVPSQLPDIAMQDFRARGSSRQG